MLKRRQTRMMRMERKRRRLGRRRVILTIWIMDGVVENEGERNELQLELELE